MVASLRQSAGGARTRAMLAAYICFAAYAAAGPTEPRRAVLRHAGSVAKLLKYSPCSPRIGVDARKVAVRAAPSTAPSRQRSDAGSQRNRDGRTTFISMCSPVGVRTAGSIRASCSVASVLASCAHR